MVGYILGNYLVEQGKISKEQLDAIMENTGRARVKLGLIAVEAGYMTTEQAEEINRLQAVVDKRFGSIAVDNGYLTYDQVSALLQKQGEEYLAFLQTLVDLHEMSLQEAEQIVLDYQQENGLTDEEREALKEDDIESIISLYLPEERKEFKKLAGVGFRTMIRCVDRDICPMQAYITENIRFKLGTLQMLLCTDGSELCTGFLETQGGLKEAASLFMGEELDQGEILCSGAELLNCINGLYVTTGQEETELLPPVMYEEDIEITVQDKICVFPVMIKGKQMYFVLFYNSRRDEEAE